MQTAEAALAPALELHGFGLSFYGRCVLISIDMLVAPTGCTALMGPSGTGKSALLRTLAGFNDNNPGIKTWGQALHFGAHIKQVHQPALVVQKAQLLVSTVLANLQTGLPNRALLTQAQQIEVIEQLAQDLHQHWVMDVLTMPVIELPLWRQRAVAILREVLTQPALLMLDEPTTGVADEEAFVLIALIRQIARNRPVLTVLHHLRQVREVADTVVLIASGRTQESGTTAQFFESPRSEAALHFLRTGSCPEYPQEASAEPCVDAELKEALEDELALQVLAPIATHTKSQANMHTPPLRFSSAASGPRGFVWLLPGQLAGTPVPGIVRTAEQDLEDLKQIGISRLLTLTEEPFDADLALGFGIQTTHLSIVDMQAPEISAAIATCREIDRCLLAGESIAVHCKAGLGRTGTMLAAYWLWLGAGGRSALKAIETIRRLNTNMIQSQVQIDFLRSFELALAAHKNLLFENPGDLG